MPCLSHKQIITVNWVITFKKTGNELIEFDVSYIIHEAGDEPGIILFIAHEDEEEAIKKLGLLKNLQSA